jgi:hypothetical protein
MPNAQTQSGDKFYISTTPQNNDLDDHASTGFPGLTYVQVKKVGSIGEYGISTNIVTYDTLDQDVIEKGKGLTNAGDPPIECARVLTDPGQIAMRAAGSVAVKDSYAFKIERTDGTVEYLRGLVTGPVTPGGRNEDFTLEVFTLGLNQVPLVIPPTP